MTDPNHDATRAAISDGPAAGPDTAVEWQAWPLRERPVAGGVAFVVIVGSGVAVVAIGGHVLFGLIAVAVLFGSLNPFFSPTRFRLDEDGVRVERWPVTKVRAWHEIRACYVDARGATLSPFVGRPWLEPYRAIRLLFAGHDAAGGGTGGSREQVVAFIGSHWEGEITRVGVASGAATEPGSEPRTPAG